ncbi:hypothetical protein THRCLA_22845 [Thraustotheca clavata]|uniref:Uncharacterized protein n=1 Tax=Thraustotheca clavata TaxID=74557 RepID=A0A1V9YRY3_9STRA|nr:hypothetical protein THRCLA_22845 [Thraustotheca clavata]
MLFDAIDYGNQKKKKDEDYSVFSVVILPWCTSFGRAVSYTTVCRVLEAWCVDNMPLQTADKLIKNIYKSALRKAARYHEKTIVAKLMMITTARASLLPNLAVFLVEQLCLIAQNPDLSTFTKKTVRNAHRCVLAIIGASIGAAIGTLIEPGFGTIIGAVGGEDWLTRDWLSNTIFFHNERLRDMYISRAQ